MKIYRNNCLCTKVILYCLLCIGVNYVSIHADTDKIQVLNNFISSGKTEVAKDIIMKNHHAFGNPKKAAKKIAEKLLAKGDKRNAVKMFTLCRRYAGSSPYILLNEICLNYLNACFDFPADLNIWWKIYQDKLNNKTLPILLNKLKIKYEAYAQNPIKNQYPEEVYSILAHELNRPKKIIFNLRRYEDLRRLVKNIKNLQNKEQSWDREKEIYNEINSLEKAMIHIDPIIESNNHNLYYYYKKNIEAKRASDSSHKCTLYNEAINYLNKVGNAEDTENASCYKQLYCKDKESKELKRRIKQKLFITKISDIKSMIIDISNHIQDIENRTNPCMNNQAITLQQVDNFFVTAKKYYIALLELNDKNDSNDLELFYNDMKTSSKDFFLEISGKHLCKHFYNALPSKLSIDNQNITISNRKDAVLNFKKFSSFIDKSTVKNEKKLCSLVEIQFEIFKEDPIVNDYSDSNSFCWLADFLNCSFLDNEQYKQVKEEASKKLKKRIKEKKSLTKTIDIQSMINDISTHIQDINTRTNPCTNNQTGSHQQVDNFFITAKKFYIALLKLKKEKDSKDLELFYENMRTSSNKLFFVRSGKHLSSHFYNALPLKLSPRSEDITITNRKDAILNFKKFTKFTDKEALKNVDKLCSLVEIPFKTFIEEPISNDYPYSDTFCWLADYLKCSFVIKYKTIETAVIPVKKLLKKQRNEKTVKKIKSELENLAERNIIERTSEYLNKYSELSNYYLNIKLANSTPNNLSSCTYLKKAENHLNNVNEEPESSFKCKRDESCIFIDALSVYNNLTPNEIMDMSLISEKRKDTKVVIEKIKAFTQQCEGYTYPPGTDQLLAYFIRANDFYKSLYLLKTGSSDEMKKFIINASIIDDKFYEIAGLQIYTYYSKELDKLLKKKYLYEDKEIIDDLEKLIAECNNIKHKSSERLKIKTKFHNLTSHFSCLKIVLSLKDKPKLNPSEKKQFVDCIKSLDQEILKVWNIPDTNASFYKKITDLFDNNNTKMLIIVIFILIALFIVYIIINLIKNIVDKSRNKKNSKFDLDIFIKDLLEVLNYSNIYLTSEQNRIPEIFNNLAKYLETSKKYCLLHIKDEEDITIEKIIAEIIETNRENLSNVKISDEEKHYVQSLFKLYEELYSNSSLILLLCIYQMNDKHIDIIKSIVDTIGKYNIRIIVAGSIVDLHSLEFRKKSVDYFEKQTNAKDAISGYLRENKLPDDVNVVDMIIDITKCKRDKIQRICKSLTSKTIKELSLIIKNEEKSDEEKKKQCEEVLN